ncbi:hypothetical protein [Govanella unica]|uniref:Uncharacterized protein n=1 Tax=Govanella unica TaxID=2975056 RepID=A0A9X3TZX1_9PROT|nr:hypothetical protein [Govania unica]MDA5194893.1 hypothetical protein [Govania unica]
MTINLQAVEEMAGPEAAAKVDAGMHAAPRSGGKDDASDPQNSDNPAPQVGTGDLLQILYAHGNLIISEAAKDSLDDWALASLSADSKVEILSYSGTAGPAWAKTAPAAGPPNNEPAPGIATYSLHEAIRTAFKRALVVRDILIAHGVAESNITLRAIGPTGDQGPAERIDVVALKDG